MSKKDLEVEIREQKHKIDNLTFELELTQNQLKDMRESNKGLDSTKFNQDKAITEYMLKVQALQREIEDKEQIITIHKTTHISKLETLIDNYQQYELLNLIICVDKQNN